MLLLNRFKRQPRVFDWIVDVLSGMSQKVGEVDVVCLLSCKNVQTGTANE